MQRNHATGMQPKPLFTMKRVQLGTQLARNLTVSCVLRVP